MAHDQRYCLECGARRGRLPGHVAQLIGAIHEQGTAAALPSDGPLAESLTGIAARPQRLEFAMPGPGAAAAAVMGMLAFGVIVGSLVGGTSVAQLANAPLIVVGMSHPAPSGSAGKVVTVQETAGGDAGAAATAGAAPAATAPPPPAVAAAPGSSAATPTRTDTSPAAGFGGLPPVKHVFLIMLSDRGFSHSFGAGSGYLSGALRRQGELVQNYYAVAAAPLANEVALISGQGPTTQTAGDCPLFAPVRPGREGPRGQVLGNGCVYPRATKTLADQLATAGHTWKAYLGGLPAGARSACRVPKLGSKQPQTGGARTAYLAWRNPFLYFRSLTAGGACRQNEVGLGHLRRDLASSQTAPSVAYLIPPACADGSEAPCNAGAAPAGLAAANRFLKTVVPVIKRSAAYKAGGLIAVTFDQAPQIGADADSSACCLSPSFPNLRQLPGGRPAPPPAAMGAQATTSPATQTTPTDPTATTTPTDPATTTSPTASTAPTAPTTLTTPADLGAGATTPTGGGGQVGLLLISPYVKPGSTDLVDYFNHFSLLASIENLFGLHRLGYAGAPGLPVFGAGVFNQYAG
jgi:hypothetical protein